MCVKFNSFILLILISFCALQISCKFEFTNIKCKALDPSFCAIQYCYIKPINRSYKYVSVRANLFQKNISKIKINFALSKRVNGYRPFLYNITVDSCRFLRNTSSHPIAEYFYNLIKSHSNMNHTCPYDHDIIIEKLSTEFLDYQLTKVLPVPKGQYLLETYWLAYDIPRAFLAFYGIIS